MFWKKKKEQKIYRLLEEPESYEMLGVWAKHLGQYTEIVGYTATGAIFLCAPETKEYLIFYPSMAGSNSKNYGVFDSPSEFEETILKEETFADYGLYPINKKELRKLETKLGPLEKDQIYYPSLDPALGGSLGLDNFTKGDVYIHSDIVGQNRGIE